MKNRAYVLGLDYGSDSCRCILVDALNGEELSSSTFEYPRWKKKLYCIPDKNQYRQHPLDYIDGLKYTIRNCLKNQSKEIIKSIKGISIDTTGSTPVAINVEGTPLALLEKYKDDPDAMFILWKDHTAIEEAKEITKLCKIWGGKDFTSYSGGVYSSEWFWAKILHTIRKNDKIKKDAYSWVEHCDWIPFLLTGGKNIKDFKRSRCAAGHKAMWSENHDGLPSKSFLNILDPYLADLRERLYNKTYTAETPVGTLSKEWSDELGLSANTLVGVGAFDAHMGAVGGNIKPYSFVKVMGTSTCDILIVPKNEMNEILVPGICGQVNGSVVAGMIGLEAGQSGFGDIYAWFKNIVAWPLKFLENNDMEDKLLYQLEEEAKLIKPMNNSLLSIDWMNGRRTPYANQELKGAILGISIGDTAPAVYRSLIEGTAFGAKAIIEQFKNENIKINEVIAIGGVAKKSNLIMQIMADVLNKTIQVPKSNQTVALGAAIFAAVSSGIYKDVESAQKVMASKFEKVYHPIKENVAIYQNLYKKYMTIGTFIENNYKDN